MEWFRSMQHSIVVKITALMGLLIVLIVAMVVISGVFSLNLRQKLHNMKNKDIVFNQWIHQANDNFLKMDDQSNMWVGMYTYGQTDTLVKSTLAQVLSAENSLNTDLNKAKTFAVTTQETNIVDKAIADALSYEGFFVQVQQMNYSQHKLAEQIMYVGNSNASNRLTADLKQLETISDNRVTNSIDTASLLSRFDTILAIVIGLIVIVIALVAMFYFRSVIAPISKISANLKRVAEGDLTGEPMSLRRSDEVGELVSTMNVMAEKLRTLITGVAETSEHVAAASEELTASAEETAKATNQIALSIQDVAGGAERQMESTREGVRAMEGISGSLRHVTDTTTAVSQSSLNMTQMADDGNRSVQEAVQQMRTINESVQHTSSLMAVLQEHSLKIGQIIETITGIAEQTNLLALNAAIEAARAGDQGRGFAVVAEEVRKLAEESAASASQITKIIQDIQTNTSQSVASMTEVANKTRQGIEVIDAAGKSFANIFDSTQGVSQQVQNVTTASREILETAKQITASIDNMAKISEGASDEAQTVAAASEEQLASMQEITASATSLSKLAQDVQQMLSQFKV